jgi:hypothetical protein
MTTNVKRLINRGFKKLVQAGYFARQDFWCCQSCAWSAIPDEFKKVVFYHKQDTARFKKTGELMLAWSGDGNEIVRAFADEGLNVFWNGKDDSRISITGLA